MVTLSRKLIGKTCGLLAKAGLLPGGKGAFASDQDSAELMLQEPWFDQLELAISQNECLEWQQQLEVMRERYAVLSDLIPVGYLILDEKGRTMEASQAAAAMLDRKRADLLGEHFMAWFAEEDRSQLLNYLHQIFLSRDHLAIELRIKTPEGVLRDVRMESRVMENSNHNLSCHMVMTDMSERIKSEQAFGLLSRVLESASEGILVTDPDKIIRLVNPAFEKSTGYAASEAIGNTPTMLKSGHHDKDFYRKMWNAVNKNGQWQGEIWNRHKNGDIYPEWLSISTVRDNQQKLINYVGIFSDVLTKEYILERLQYLAYYDGLTGLPNRRLFLDRLNMSLSQARRDKHMLAVIFIDLDKFKQINDTLGHRLGDEVLIAVSGCMKGCLRDEDTLARLGGDEFTAILPIISHPDAASNVAQKILECFTKPLHIDGHELHVTVSIGISIFPNDGEDADSLLNRADIALYQVKGAGSNGYLQHGDAAH